jgi:hypothetical protein
LFFRCLFEEHPKQKAKVMVKKPQLIRTKKGFLFAPPGVSGIGNSGSGLNYIPMPPNPVATWTTQTANNLGNLINGSGNGAITISPPALIGSISSLPRDSEIYESVGATNLVHAASPNTMRIRTIAVLDGIIDIQDDTTRVFDLLKATFSLQGRVDGYLQHFFFFVAEGPSDLTLTDGDYDPSAGVWTAIDNALDGATETRFLRTVVVKPFRENGAWVTATSLEIDLTKTINSFTVKSEKALAQGRSQPKLLLGLIANGTV